MLGQGGLDAVAGSSSAGRLGMEGGGGASQRGHWGECLSLLLLHTRLAQLRSEARSLALLHGDHAPKATPPTATAGLQRHRTPSSTAAQIASVAAHLAASGQQAMDDIWPLIQEKILATEPQDARKVAFTVLEMLLYHASSAQPVAQGLVARMQSGPRPSKLAVALFAEHLMLEMPQSPQTQDQASISGLGLLDALMDGLVSCIASDGKRDEETGQLQPTRLTSLASAIVLAHIANRTSTLTAASRARSDGSLAVLIDDGSDMRSLALHFVSYLGALSAYATDNPMTAPCFDQFSCILSAATEQLPASMDALAQVIRTIGRSIAPRDAVSDAKLVKLLYKTLEAANADLLLTTIQVCGILAMQPVARVAALVASPSLQPLIMTLVLDAIQQSDSQPLRVLAFALLRRTIVQSSPAKLRSVLDPLLALLKPSPDSEAAPESKQTNGDKTLSQGVAGIIAEYAAHHPRQALGGVFDLITSEHRSARQNGLFVLEQVIGIHKTGIETLELSQLSAYLGEKLLACLGDADLTLRKQAIFVFSHLEPSQVIPTLAGRLTSRDERERSAAEESLVALMLQHKAFVHVLMTFIEYTRVIDNGKVYKPMPVYQTPAEIGRMQQLPSPGDAKEIGRTVDRLVRVLAKYVSGLDADRAASVVPALVAKLYGCPSDALLVRLMSTFAPLFVKSKNGTVRALKTCLSFMAHQPRLEDDFAATAATDDLQSLLFVRLCPLLILKIVPMAALDALPESLLILDNIPAFFTGDRLPRQSLGDDTDSVGQAGHDSWTVQDTQSLVDHLIVRIEHPFEFKDVQRQACEVLAHLPLPILAPVLAAKLDTLTATSDSAGLRLYIFTACHAVAARGLPAIEMQFMDTVVPRLIRVMLTLSSTDNDEATAKAHAGAMDCLALCLSMGASHASLVDPVRDSSALPLIQEVLDNGDAVADAEQLTHASMSFGSFVALVAELVNPIPHLSPAAAHVLTGMAIETLGPVSETRCKMSTLMANAVTVAVKQLSGPLQQSQQQMPMDAGDKRFAALLWLASRLLASLVDAAMHMARHSASPSMDADVSVSIAHGAAIQVR
ncbi:armadillo-type protein, partial [Entophlyctis helioformis]